MTGAADLAVAERAVRAAGAVALARFGGPLAVERKTIPSDIVTEADRAAEAAAVAVLRAERPRDGLLGEEGANADGARRWVVDALDGTLAFVRGLSGWCVAVALEDADGPLAAAVLDPVDDVLSLAARGAGAHVGGRALSVTRGRPLREAVVSTFIDPRFLTRREDVDALVAVVTSVAHVRSGGGGTLELARVAAGLLDAWFQFRPAVWDWLPGALLVREAGGRAVTTPSGFCLAGSAEVVDALVGLVEPG